MGSARASRQMIQRAGFALLTFIGTNSVGAI